MTNLLQPTGEDNHFQQIRMGIETRVVMIPLLGVTWLFGLLSPVHKTFVHIFTILNSAQGFLIFSLHCMRNTQLSILMTFLRVRTQSTTDKAGI
ncbi:adhesion G-protein coupled receptor D1-like [Pocillopora verrucosa]|uniref:adhesion G-protein coupled receptor D1-like n=1 Tax=Pocillopora verrucosa TaxID=203993 RepID=UPI003341044C